MINHRIVRVRTWNADDEAHDDLFRLSEKDFRRTKRIAGRAHGVEQAREFIARHGRRIEPDSTIEISAL